MDLILWRHAEAEDAARGGDLARALTARGRAQAERMAEWLAPRLADDALILVSPAKRCQQTVAPGAIAATVLMARPSGATAQMLLDAAGWPAGDGSVLVQ